MGTNDKTDNTTEILVNGQRREAVKTIIGGITVLAAYTALPVKWNKPIVESIFLPAHAATSGTSLHDPCSLSLVSGDRTSSAVVIQVDGYVTPATAGLPTRIVAIPENTGNPTTEETTTRQDGRFTATLTITGGPGITRINVETTVTGADGTATCALDIYGSSMQSSDPDTDGDGVPDSADLCPGHDDTINIDNDGYPDGCDPNPFITTVDSTIWVFLPISCRVFLNDTMSIAYNITCSDSTLGPTSDGLGTNSFIVNSVRSFVGETHVFRFTNINDNLDYFDLTVTFVA